MDWAILRPKIATDYKRQCSEFGKPVNEAIVRTMQTKSDELNLIFRGNYKLNFNQRMQDQDLILLLSCLQNYKDQIKHVDLSFNDITNVGIQELSKFLVGCTSLETLNLQSNKIGVEGGEQIAEAIKNILTLTQLNLNQNNLQTKGTMAIVEMLFNNKTLIELNLANNGIDHDGVIAITSILNWKNNTLQILNLDNPVYHSIGQETAIHFGKMFHSNRGLEKISLQKHNFTCDAIYIITEHLLENNKLRVLDLTANRISFKGCEAIAKYLCGEYCVLESLILTSNRTGHYGAKAIAQALSKNRTLIHLDMVRNDIDDNGLKMIAESLETNDMLVSLKLYQNHFGQMALQAFHKYRMKNNKKQELRDSGIFTLIQWTVIQKWLMLNKTFLMTFKYRINILSIDYQITQMQIIKVFTKSYDAPSGIISSRFITKNGRKITLQLSDTQLYRISDKGVKIAQLSSNLRFQIKTIRQLSYLMLETDHISKPIEYQFLDPIGMWEILLKQKLPQMDYQKYYEMEKLLGSGSFASVYCGKNKADGTKVAVKAFLKKMLIQQDPHQWRVFDYYNQIQIDNEVKVMKYMNHPNILKLYDVFENKAQIYLITELCRGGNLDQAIKKLEEPLPALTVKVIFRQIVEGIKYMHDIGLMHRDIKPGNILFKKPISLKQFGLSVQEGPLISDFGVASTIKKQLDVYQFCGSYGYMAPEIFACEDDKNITYNEKCDVFSLGCLLYELITSKPLFSGANLKQINKECQLNSLKILDDCFGNRQIHNLLMKMLTPIPEQRLSCQDVLNHPSLQVEFDDNGCPLFKDYKKPMTLSIQKPRFSLKSKSSAILPQTSRRNETQSFKRLSNVLPPIKRLSTEIHN